MPSSFVEHPELSTPASSATPEEELFCPECAYNLHALRGVERCPECGLPIDRQGFARSQIPWVHRRHLGRVRAYWRTVWLATLRPARVAAEASRHVSYVDAQRFRWLTAFVAAAPVIGGLVAAMAWYGNAAIFTLVNPVAIPGWAMGGKPSPMFDLLIPWDSGATLPPVIPLAVLIAMISVTGVASYWFHPKWLPVVRQNRAVALSYYGCAPLALASVPVLLFIAGWAMTEAGLDNEASATWAVVRVVAIGTVLSGLGVVALAWRSTMVLLRRTTRLGMGHPWLAGGADPGRVGALRRGRAIRPALGRRVRSSGRQQPALRARSREPWRARRASTA